MKRIAYIDFLRIISAFSVVAIHVAITAIAVFPGKPIECLKIYSSLDILISWLQVNLNRYSVPIFVMITGFMLLQLDKDISIKDLFKKYILRVLVVLFIYGTIFAYIEILFSKTSSNQFLNIIYSFLNVLIGKSWDHLWYLYMLLGLYIILPLLKIFIKFSTKNQQLYLIIIGFIFTSILPITSTLYPIDLSIYFPINTVFVFYLLWGYYLGNYSIKNEKLLMYLGIVSLVFIILFTFLFIYFRKELFNQLIYPYLSPLFIGLSTSIFIYFKYVNNILTKYYSNTVKLLSRCSFGIYIYHIFFIHVIYKFFKFNPFNHNVLVIYILITFIVFILSFITTYITIKIPFFKKYI